jgi:hypothetical protein
MADPGSPQLAPKPQRPRAFVIRLPGVFVGYNGHKIKGSFQTVVMALSEEQAWDLAIQHDVWQQLPFDVPNVQIFPKDPAVKA